MADCRSRSSGDTDSDKTHRRTEVNDAIMWHLKTAGKLHMWKEIETHLIGEFNLKKMPRGRDGYNTLLPEVRRYYDEFIVESPVRMIFPLLQEFLEDVLLNHLPPVMNRSDVVRKIYRDHHEKPSNLRFDSFNRTHWKLSLGPDMTADDELIMRRYRDGLSMFMLCSVMCQKDSVSTGEICISELGK